MEIKSYCLRLLNMATAELTKNIILDEGTSEAITVSAGEHLIHVQVIDKNENRLTVSVAENATYTNFLISSQNLSSEINVNLVGVNSTVKLYGLLPQTEQSNVKTNIQHLNNNGFSEQEYRYILNGQASPNFESELTIHPKHIDNKALQFCRALLLDNNSRLMAKPSLRIANDKVECSHGIALGKVEEKYIEYLNQRGIPKTIATGMLVHAFANEIIAKLPTPETRHSALLQLQTVL